MPKLLQCNTWCRELVRVTLTKFQFFTVPSKLDDPNKMSIGFWSWSHRQLRTYDHFDIGTKIVFNPQLHMQNVVLKFPENLAHLGLKCFGEVRFLPSYSWKPQGSGVSDTDNSKQTFQEEPACSEPHSFTSHNVGWPDPSLVEPSRISQCPGVTQSCAASHMSQRPEIMAANQFLVCFWSDVWDPVLGEAELQAQTFLQLQFKQTSDIDVGTVCTIARLWKGHLHNDASWLSVRLPVGSPELRKGGKHRISLLKRSFLPQKWASIPALAKAGVRRLAPYRLMDKTIFCPEIEQQK